MKINYTHELNDLSIKKMDSIHNRLKGEIFLDDDLRLDDIKVCAGVDVSYFEKDDKMYGVCAIVLIDFVSLNLMNTYLYKDEVNPVYTPGYLSIKELPLIIKAIESLPEDVQPDIFMFDGNGLLHPNKVGLATHASFFLGKPTIGVAKTYLKVNNIDYHMPKNELFDYCNIVIGNEARGVALRTSIDVKPIFVSPGNYISLEKAVECVKRLTTNESRVPLPTRLADIKCNAERKRLLDSNQVVKQSSEDFGDDEKYYLLTKERLKTFNPNESICEEELMKELGLTQKDLDSVPDEEIGFE